jgi:hypothetical protein
MTDEPAIWRERPIATTCAAPDPVEHAPFDQKRRPLPLQQEVVIRGGPETKKTAL